MKVVVTGGAGFIGANLCRALAAVPEVDPIVVLDDLSSGTPGNIAQVQRLRFVHGSVLDGELVGSTLRGADAVVHLAAQPSASRSVAEPERTYAVNVTGTTNVLDAARREGAHVVLASSAAVYGNAGDLAAQEEQQPAPTSPYGSSKLAAERCAASFADQFGLDTLVLRLFNVYGPLQAALGSDGPVLPAVLGAALEDRPLTIHGDGAQSRDFVFVDTVTEVIVRSVLGRVTSRTPVNVATGVTCEVRGLVRLLEREVGRALDVRYSQARAGDVRASAADLSLFRRIFPDVTPTGLREGLRLTLAAARQQLQRQAEADMLQLAVPGAIAVEGSHLVRSSSASGPSSR